MNENENNFESLRRLLALKRHESPPPGYFNNFSSRVIARIRAGKPKASASWLELPWLSKFLEALQAKPAFAGGFAATLCLLLIAGIIYAGQTESAPQQLLSPEMAAITPMASTTSLASLPQTVGQPMLASSDNSTNPVFGLPPVASLFDQIQPSAQPVSYSPSGN